MEHTLESELRRCNNVGDLRDLVLRHAASSRRANARDRIFAWIYNYSSTLHAADVSADDLLAALDDLLRS